VYGGSPGQIVLNAENLIPVNSLHSAQHFRDETRLVGLYSQYNVSQ